jgi:hypothetical protein
MPSKRKAEGYEAVSLTEVILPRALERYFIDFFDISGET